MNILIIENDANSAIFLEDFFKNNKDFKEIKMKIIHSSIYLVKEIVKFESDVVLIDLIIEQNDLEFVKQLSSLELTRDIPIIIISDISEQESVKNAILAGCFEYIKKPINFLELTNKIKMAYKYRLNNKKLKQYQLYANINESLLQARRIQTSLFPDRNKRKLVLTKSDILYIPKDILTGDFLWISQISETQKLVFVGDCTGHGLPGSLLTVMAYTLLDQNFNYRYEYKPSEILNYLTKEFNILLNSQDTYTNNDGIDGICLLIDNNYIEYSSSHIHMIIVSNSKKLIMDGEQKIAYCKNETYYLFNFTGNIYSIGRESINQLFDNHRVKLNCGDRIYLFTDGYVDQFGSDHEKVSKFSKKRFYQILLDIQEESLESQIDILYQKFQDWKGTLEQLDDIMVFVIEI